MTLDAAVLRLAGVMVGASLLLGVTVSPWWLAMTGFVGLNLVQAGFTGFCPAAIVLRKLGVRPGPAFN